MAPEFGRIIFPTNEEHNSERPRCLQGSFRTHPGGHSPLDGIVLPHWGSSLGLGTS